MGIKDSIKGAIKSLDFFATNEFFRYDKQSTYATLTGGICSIILIVIFFALFTNLALQTATMQLINSS